jgi:uncharacterized protein
MLPSIQAPLIVKLAVEIAAKPQQVAAAVELLDEGATVPFIARYRKEATGGLDDNQLRLLEERLRYLRELEERRDAILESIESQGKLTEELKASIEKAEDKTTLEDLYLPYKPKRRTKAMIAREAGLEPLADALLADPMLKPEAEAQKYISLEPKGTEKDTSVPDVKAALEGAKQILMERFAEDAKLLSRVRDHLTAHGVVESRVIEGQQEAGAKFADYFNYSETWKTIPSHRALAIFRGRNEGFLSSKLMLDSEIGEEKPSWSAPFNACEDMIAGHAKITNKGRPADKWLAEVVRWTWRIKVSLHMETELMAALREKAELEAIHIFASNLKDLLLAAPAGPRATMGIDPGIRTGCKIAVVDATGKLLDTATIYPHEPRRDWEGSLHTLAVLAKKHSVDLISIGNGTASRETDKLAADLIKRLPEQRMTKIVVSEAGASVYSASEFASKELPELDVSLRGAVSIARRLQDPLAELVKIDPKSIGVGQYQHDVNQTQLARSLDAVVEDCVNAVGVDVNTASPALLARVSGLTSSVAANIVNFRNANGAFKSREQLKSVPRLGDKAFEQAAGFLRIANGENPLDASSVHPEAYPVVERILADIQKDVKAVMGDGRLVKSLHPEKYADERFGVPTITDILKELEKPGRDPRPEFKTATFQDGVEELRDLQPGMILEGVITNVAAFGAFVDIGVHQDGLVHISALAEKFVKDPRDVVKAGDVVKVKVLEVDEKRKRIALTMRLNDSATPREKGPNPSTSGGPRPKMAGNPRQSLSSAPQPTGGAMAAAFAKLKERA